MNDRSLYEFVIMSQINLGQEKKPNHEQENKQKPNIRAAIRLAQKQQQEIIEHLNEFHDEQVIKQIKYDQEKTQLQKYLDIPSSKRNKKILKGVKGQLSYLSCFQVQTQTQIPKQLLAIMKRDIQMLIAVISPFVYAKLYPKGSIIETVTNQRSSIKVLLQGQVAIYEPINYKSYKNCVKIAKEAKANTLWLSQIIHSFNTIHSNQHFYHGQEQQDLAISNIIFNPQDIKQEVQHNLRKKLKPMSIQLSKRILTYSNIISPMTPHRLTKLIKQPGILISSQRQAFVVNQPKIYQHTSICLTEVYVLQLQYDVYKASISLLNSDQEKLYIQILLKKFQMFQYFDAKQYVKKQFMIDKLKQEKHQNQQAIKNEIQGESIIITSPLNPIQKITKKRTNTDHSSIKSQKSSKSSQSSQEIIQTFDIKYEGDIYLIISGEVTLIVDKITENRAFAIEHSSKIKTFKPQKLLKLYSMDIFGFEEIGKIKEYNLRYRVNKQSKLLLLNENIYVKHFSQIEGFRHLFKSLQIERNQLLSSMLKRIEDNINEEMGKIYQSISKILPQKSSPRISNSKKSASVFHSTNIVRKIEYIGNIEFQSVQNKIKEKLIREKQGAQSNLNFKQMIKSGQQLKDSLSFASQFKKKLPKNCEIIGDYIEIRDNKGNLKRKKHIGGAQDGKQRKQSLIFRKLGIISDKDRNDHNFALVSNRKSKYQLEDFGKQKKQMERLKNMAHSLPKLNYYYAKKQQILYNNIHKRDF